MFVLSAPICATNKCSFFFSPIESSTAWAQNLKSIVVLHSQQMRPCNKSVMLNGNKPLFLSLKKKKKSLFSIIELKSPVNSSTNYIATKKQVQNIHSKSAQLEFGFGKTILICINKLSGLKPKTLVEVRMIWAFEYDHDERYSKGNIKPKGPKLCEGQADNSYITW